MFIDPASLSNDRAKIEEVEKASARLVAQAIYEFRETAAEIFAREKDVAREVPTVVASEKGNCLTTSMVVKYHYSDAPVSKLLAIIVASVPNGMLQDFYNPTATDTIWRTGRNAPTLGEVFRVRLVFSN